MLEVATMGTKRALDQQPTVTVEPAAGKNVPIQTPTAMRSPLGATERLLVAKTDGRRSIDQIADLIGFSSREARAAFGRLEELGIVRLHAQHDSVVPIALDEGWLTEDDGPPSTTRT